MLGQKVFAGSYDEKQVVIAMTDLPAGLYLVKINDRDIYKVTKQ